ncbi:MAG TPA: response regulator [Verrucomicrobiae bacterium]|nr:response regulator [Verrucomicrobiae bacterium]
MKITVRRKILIIEDQAELLMAMILSLERAGFGVFGVQTGRDGIRLSQTEEFDLVILDVNLPGQDGFEVFTRLKRDFRYSRTPIIFISDHWNEENRRRARELGAADCLDKPLDAPDFVRRIFSHVRTVQAWPDKNIPDR